MKPRTNTLLSTTTLALCGMFLLTPHGGAAEKDTLNATDVEFVKHEAAAGMATVKIAGLGAKKATRPEVKSFAEMIVKEHTAANEELKKLAATKGVELSAVIDAKHAEMFQKLEQYSGTEFDKEFLDAAVSGHKKCVGRFEDAAKDSQDNDVKMWAAKMLPALKSHLAQAEELNGSPATRTTKDGSTTKDADNTERNMRDRDARTLTPLDQGNSQPDLDTTAQIRKEIVGGKDMSMNAKNVKIITNGGKVMLRGPVNSAEEKRIIGEIAERVAKAGNVTNQLEVKSDSN
jgi:putative membrane protein